MGNIGHNLLPDRHCQQSVESGINVRLNLGLIGTLCEVLDRRGLFSLSESDFDSRSGRCLRDQLFLNCVIVVLNDLDLGLEFVNFCLHQLLGDLSHEIEVKLNETALHNFLAELD